MNHARWKCSDPALVLCDRLGASLGGHAHEADVRGDYAPAVRCLHPDLTLTPHLARHRIAPEFRVGRREVAPVGGDDNVAARPCEPGCPTCAAKAGDLFVAIEILADAVAQREPAVPEQLVHQDDV